MTPVGAHGAALDFPTEVYETGDDGADNESDDELDREMMLMKWLCLRTDKYIIIYIYIYIYVYIYL